jgi:peptide/nickel transport system permease protein
MTLAVPTPPGSAVAPSSRGRRRRNWFAAVRSFIRRQPVGSIGMFLVLIFGIAGLFANWLAPYDPTANDFSAMTLPPPWWPGAPPESWGHWLGTDQLGRDILSRILFGARTAYIVGISSALVGGLSGLVLGVGSAYFGGWIDLILQRVLDIVMSFPLIIMALAVVSAFPNGLKLSLFGSTFHTGSVSTVIFAITIPLIPRCARVVRSSALAIREVPYIDAARALGFGHRRIILRHMVPNVIAPFLIMLTSFVGQAILAEAALSYLGLGVQEPVPAWGLMLQGGAEEYATTAPWIAIFPGLAIMLTVFGINLFGDSLRDVLDPKLRDR